MTWNYRIMKHEEKGQVYYQIHEAFYDDLEQEATSWAGPIEPGAETVEGLKADLDLMLQAFQYPVLEPKQVPQ